MEDWLNTITRDFQDLTSLEQIAQTLKDGVETQRKADEGTSSASPMIIHVGGFERKKGVWLPYVWHITNTHSLGRFAYLNVDKTYTCTEHMYGPFKDVAPSEVRKVLK